MLISLKYCFSRIKISKKSDATSPKRGGNSRVRYGKKQHWLYLSRAKFSQPLLLRNAQGKLAAAKLRLDKPNRNHQAEEQKIRNEVLDAISAINLAYKKFAALEIQVNKAEQVYQGERERFKVGDSTV